MSLRSFLIGAAVLLTPLLALIADDFQPNPPSSLTGTQISANRKLSNFISWSPAVDTIDVSRYHVFRDEGLTVRLATVSPINPLEYTDTSVKENTAYSYYVISEAKSGLISTPASVIITPPGAPLPPTSFSGKFVKDGKKYKNVLTWAAPESGPKPRRYEIFRDPAMKKLVDRVSAKDELTCEDKKVDKNGTYTYYIVSEISGGGNSVPVSITVSGSQETPAAPINLNGQQVKKGNKFINILTWSAPATPPTPVRYEIYRDAALTDFVDRISANSLLRYEDKKVKADTPYTYYIVSEISGGKKSAPSSVTVEPFKEAPEAPTNATAYQVIDGGTTVNWITWSAPAGGINPAIYNIYTDAALTNLLVVFPAYGTLKFYDKNALPGVRVTYYIVSVGSDGALSPAAEAPLEIPE